MTEDIGFKQRWLGYRPSKTALFWSCAACVLATMIVGFTWGGWTTDERAQAMREEAVEQARAELAAAVCAERFIEAAGSRERLADFRESSSWGKDKILEDGGWALIAGREEPYDGSVDLCAERLMEVELKPAQTGEPGNATTAG